MAGSGLDVDSVIERLLSVRGQPNNRTVQLAEGEIRALCATARYVSTSVRPGVVRIRNLHGFFHLLRVRRTRGKLGFDGCLRGALASASRSGAGAARALECVVEGRKRSSRAFSAGVFGRGARWTPFDGPARERTDRRSGVGTAK